MGDEYEDYGDYDDYGDYEGSDKEIDAEEGKVDLGPLTLTKKKSMVFVTISEIKDLIKKKCEEICELTGLSFDESVILYNHFHWRKDLIEQEWFGNESKISKAAGLEPLDKQPENNSNQITCPMCFDTKPRTEFDNLKCNHYLCKECYQDYIDFNVMRPENIFFWRCPFNKCNLIIPDSFNKKYIPENKLQNYYKKMAIAYADNSKSLRWCPGTDCQFGCEVESIVARTVNCPCGWVYCFKCGLEDHQPCDCEVAKEWSKKDETGGATAKWLLAFTKDCPKCKRPIEKNQGCNYMKCRHPGCGQEFCWLCLADWKTHNDHFKCNKYDNLSKEEKKKMDDDKQKERSDLQKYAFYYERYHNNDVAIKSVEKIIKTYKQEQKDLAIHLSLSLTQLEFLLDACHVLRNSKRILKWSYGYGFYLDNDLQRNLYEIIQEKLDMYSSELHVLLEKDYEKCKENISEFTKFKDKVLASVYKCKQSATAFLEKMEEFENALLEEQLKKGGSTTTQTPTTNNSETKKKGGFFSKLVS